MADQRAQEIINQITTLMAQFGVPVTVTRTIQAQTPIRNVFGTPTNATVSTFSAQVIVESQPSMVESTIAGGKVKEKVKFQAQAGVIKRNDEIAYGGHTYKVTFTEPVPFAGSDVVNFIHAEREVD